MSSSYTTSEPRAASVPRLGRAQQLSAAAHAQRQAVATRDAGLWRIGSVTRWLLAGAIGSTAALALLAAGTFHGHTVSSAPPAPASAAASTAAGAGAGSSLAGPSQAPAPAAAPPVVVSGGS